MKDDWFDLESSSSSKKSTFFVGFLAFIAIGLFIKLSLLNYGSGYCYCY